MIKIRMIALALLGMVLIGGCEEQLPKTEKTDKTISAAKNANPITAIVANPENLINPMEYFGQEHNRRLTGIDKMIQSKGNDSREAIRRYNIAQAGSDDKKDFGKYLDELEEAVEAYNTNEDFVLGQLEPEAATYMKSITDMVGKLESLDTYNHFIPAVKRLEACIMEDKALNERDRNVLLVAASIGRHSAYWWQEKIRREEIPDTGRGWFNRFLQLHAYVNGDLIAGAIGMFTESNMGDVIDGAVGISSYFSWYVNNNW